MFRARQFIRLRPHVLGGAVAAAISTASSCHQAEGAPPHISFQPKVQCDAMVAARRFDTLRQIDQKSSKQSLAEKYKVDFASELGVGAFGSVHLAENRQTGQKVALKKISKVRVDPLFC